MPSAGHSCPVEESHWLVAPKSNPDFDNLRLLATSSFAALLTVERGLQVELGLELGHELDLEFDFAAEMIALAAVLGHFVDVVEELDALVC